MGGPRSRKGAKVDPAKMEQYKEVCPPHKLKDLDALVKSLKGKDAEIKQKIMEWWEEPQVVEPEWEDVNTKSSAKKKQQQQQQQQRESSSRGGRGGPGRGGRGYRGGGRGSGSERRRSDRRRSPPPQSSKSPQPQDQQPKPEARNDAHDVPAPVANAPAPKGAWGQRGAAAAAPAAPEPAPVPSPAKPVTPVKPEIPEPPVDVGVVAPQDPTPAGMNGSATTTPSKPGGNVWATKGSAHLIQAEKPKPPPLPPPPPQMRMPPQTAEPPKSSVKQTIEPTEIAQGGSSALESGLPSNLSGVNTGSWNNNAAPSLDMTQSASSVAEATLASMAPEVSAVPEPPGSPAKPPPAAPAPANVLNMGHWEAGEGDDSQNLDFGFGSFGPESDAATEEPASQAPPAMPANEACATVSPARPPPGLSIGGGGMPPMPANAVLVHELEGKLESTTLGKPEEQAGAPKPMASNLPTQPPPPAGQPGPPPGVSQNYNAAYGGMGMYNYTNAGASGFMGQNPAPGLGGPPQQKPGISGPPGGAPQHAPQQQPPPGGLYGSAAPPAGTPGDSTAAPSSTETSTTAAAGIPPPGMPNAMAYNPALFYGQQPYQMGQPHGGVAGYGYGYGAQFGAAGGFYGQQVMGQSGGYPSYDDQPPQGRGDYPSKGNSRYRGSGNQYQNQFNPQQHGGYGYGGQPMGGYNVDHFNQRGGYGHGPPADPYGMAQQQGGSNYDKKGGRFRQAPQQLGQQEQQQQQQNAPFLGGNNESSNANQGSGWSNNNNSNTNNQGGGGWDQPSAWQGGN